MEDLYNLMNSNKNREEVAVKIIELFEPKIKKSLTQTHSNNREELDHVLKIKIFEVVKNYEIRELPGFFEFVDSVNDKG